MTCDDFAPIALSISIPQHVHTYRYDFHLNTLSLVEHEFTILQFLKQVSNGI